MALLDDCAPGGTFEPADPSLVLATVVVEGTTIDRAGVNFPAVAAVWAEDADFMTNPYITGIQFEYGPSDLSAGVTRSAVQGKEMLSWSASVGAGGSYTVRYRAVGGKRDGFWSVPETVIVPDLAGVVDVVPPATPTGLSVTTTVRLNPVTGQPQSTIVATWALNTEPDMAGYQTEITRSGGSPLTAQIGSNRAEWDADIGVSYSVRVAAFDRAGNLSGYTAPGAAVAGNDTSAPATPTGFSATGTIGGAFLEWTAPSDADVSVIEIYENSTNSIPATPSAQRATLPGAKDSYTRDNLTPGSTRYFWLKAKDYSGNRSAATASASITVGSVPAADTTAPGQPTGLTLSSVSVPNSVGDPYVRITATWTSPGDSDINHYDVEITESGFTIVVPTTTAAYGREALTGRVYSIRVRAVDNAGNLGPWTAIQTVTGAGDSTAPAAPTGLAVSTSLGAAFLSWTAPSASDTVQILVFENTTNNSATATMIAPVTAQPSAAGSYARSGLNGGDVRYYWVKAVDTSGNVSGFSSGVTATIPSVTIPAADTTPPAVPTGLSVTSALTTDAAGNPAVRVVATWSANGESDLDHYDLEVTSGGTTIVRFAGTNRDEFPARSGVSYSCRVRAVDRAGNPSAWSSAQATTASGDTTPPSAPTSLNVGASLGAVFLTCSAPSDSDTTEVEFFENSSNNSGTAYSLGRTKARPSTIASFSRPGLPAGLVAYYWVKAVDASGNVSGFSAGVSITLPRVEVTDFASTIKPVELMTTVQRLAATPTDGRQVFDTTQKKLYRGTGLIWDKSTDGADIIADSITAGQIAAGAISTTELASGAITTDKLGALQITSEKIAAGAITTDTLAALAITSAKIAAGAIITDKLAAGAITAEKIAAGVIDATRLTISNRQIDVGITWTANSPGPNQLSWSSGHVAYQNTSGGQTIAPISAGTITWTGSPAWLGVWFNRTAGILVSGDSAIPANNPDDVLLAVYRGGTGLMEIYGRTTIEGDFIRTGAIVTRTIAANAVTATEIAAGSITTAKLVAGAVTANEIAAGAISTDKLAALSITTAKLAAGAITAEKIAAGAITAASVTISGATTLADWRQGGDDTKIAGGSIATNSIAANRIVVGQRAINTTGFDFVANPATNVVSWSAGQVLYTNANNVPDTISAGAGSYTYTGGVAFFYVTPGGSSLLVTTNKNTLDEGSTIVLGTYTGGTTLAMDHGRTIIDGTGIRTGSITAGQIAAGTITADRLAATNLAAIFADLGTVTSGLMRNAGSTFGVNASLGVLVNFTGSYMKVVGSGFGASSNLDEWYGPKPSGATLADPKLSTLTTTNGAWAMAAGVVYFGTAPLTPGGDGDLTVNTDFGQTIAGGGTGSVYGSAWQVLAQATLTNLVAGQLISADVAFALFYSGNFLGNIRLREGASTILVPSQPLNLDSGAPNDAVSLQAAATASGTVTYYLEAQQTGGTGLDSQAGSTWSIARFATATSSQAGLMSATQAAQLAALVGGGGGSGGAITVGTDAEGQVRLIPWTSATESGYIDFRSTNGGSPVRRGYIGTGNATRIPIVGDGAIYYEFDKTPRVGANVIYHGGNLVAATTSVDGLMSAADKVTLNSRAPLASPAFSGSPTVNGNGLWHGGNLANVTTSFNGIMLSTDKSKLDGIAAGATANSSDASLRARSSHTGTQSWSTITGAPAITALTASSGGTDGTVVLRSGGFINTGTGFSYPHPNVYSYSGSGAVYYNANLYALSFTVASDRSWKRNIRDLDKGHDNLSALDLVLRMRPRRFDWTADGRSSFGYIAQELQLEAPEAVRDVFDKDGVFKGLGIEQGPLSAMITAGLQEFYGRFESALAEIDDLKARLAALEVPLAG